MGWGLVVAAGVNGRDVIVSGTSGLDGTGYQDAFRVDHVTGTSTALPNLLAASADSSTVITDAFRWVDLNTVTSMGLPDSVPRDYASVVMSADGATVAARAPLGQRSWIVDVHKAAGTATATLVPVTGVVQAISRGGRFVLIGTACHTDTDRTDPTVICTGSVRWDRRLQTVSSLGGVGRTTGLGIGDGGEVVLISFDGTTTTVVLNQPGRSEVVLDNAPHGFPVITADARIVLFIQTSSGFTNYAAYDRVAASGVNVGFRPSFPSLGAHSTLSGVLSTDGSTFVSIDAVRSGSGTSSQSSLSVLWTPVTVAPTTARLRPEEILAVHVGGVGGVAADASSVMLSVTVTDPGAEGFATVWPCGQPRPLASNINVVAGQTRANAVLARIGTNGDICVASNVAINVVVDVQGWFEAVSPYHALTPARVVDTRTGAGQTVGAINTAGGLRIPLRANNVVGVDANAAMLNITATNTVADGYVTVWPCGTPSPTASNLNISPGATVANAVLTGLDAADEVCVSSNVATDIIIDVQGWFPARSGYRPTNPVRLVDTRGGETDTVGNQPGEQTLVVPIADVDSGATAAMLNVTVTNPTDSGYATVWPCDQSRPLASNANFRSGETVAVAVLARVSVDTTICVAANTRADIIVDLNGSLTTASTYHPVAPTRIFDTRS